MYVVLTLIIAINCVVIVYTGESEGTMSKRGLGIEGRHTYVKYSACHLINSLKLVAWIWMLFTHTQENVILVNQHDYYWFCANT